MSTIISRSTGGRFFALAFVVGGLAWGCAAGQSDDPPSDDDGSGGSTSSAGGAGSVGGSGGTGGDSLCEMDCSSVQAPPCQVAVCNDGSYPGTVGSCVVVADTDGTACDDGEFCTVDDACLNGVCEGGPPNDCGMTPEPCEEITCDEGSDSCSVAPANEGASCTSTDLCLVNTVCQNGVCGGGVVKDCTFAPLPEPDECYVSSCNPANGMCEPEVGNDGAACDDPMDLCTVSKTCSNGACVGGVPKDCSALTMGCTTGVCDTATGNCMGVASGEGMACDDLNGCTTGEICTSGNCGGGTPVTNCSMTQDGCCPTNCTAANDFDCNCPGEFVNGTCVYVPNIGAQETSQGAAQAVCQGLGAGWDLCAPTDLCDPGTYTYLDMAGCDCSGGNAACNCEGINLYFWVTGGQPRYYVRQPTIAGCSVSAQCTNSTSATGCANAICCK